MNKLIIACLLVIFLMACERKPYVEHELKFERVADNCTEQQTYFRMNSNFGGERYEFEKCLAADFNKGQLMSERKGDTVVISFPKILPAQKNVVFHITLDIDSYPKYNFLTIDENTYSIIPAEK